MSDPIFQVQHVPHRPLRHVLTMSPAFILRMAETSEVIAAMRRGQSRTTQRTSNKMPNVVFWSYVSETYFRERVGVPQVGQEWLVGEQEPVWGDEQALQQQIRRLEIASGGLLQELRTAVSERFRGNYTVNPASDVWTYLLHPSAHFPLLTSLFKLASTSSRTSSQPFLCEVCVNCTNPVLRPSVACSLCGLVVHLDCYGLSKIPEKDWHCEMCAVQETTSKRPLCAVCRKQGGAMKQGVTNAVGETGWAHIFCVDSLPGACYTDDSTKSGVDLQKVDPRRCSLRCEFCAQCSGACIQCSFRSCLNAFHPSCWQTAFVKPFQHTDFVFTCSVHKDSEDLKTRLERSHLRDLQSFIKDLSSSHPFSKSRTVASSADLQALTSEMRRNLQKHNYMRRKLGFIVMLNRKKRCVEVDAPVMWNSLSPEVFKSEGLIIAGRTKSESSALYSASYSRIQKRLQSSMHEFTLQDAEALKLKTEELDLRRKRDRERPTLIRVPLHYLTDSF